MFIQRRNTKLAMLIALPTFILSLSACEVDNADSLEAAQACLNEMNSDMSTSTLASKAAECRALVSGIDLEKAFVIECSSYFLENGFFGTKISTAFSRVTDQGTNDTFDLLSTFTFTSTSTAALAETACAKTGVQTLSAFGAMANASTKIGNAGGLLSSALISTPPTTAQFSAAIAAVDTDAEREDLGSSIASIGNALCDSSSSSSSGLDSACSTLNAVTAGASNLIIGTCAQECISGSTASGSACSADSSIVCP